ncbi:MAG TPA: hypothetical protein VGQ99_18190 [Tepidisphaeraceae bacterium]|jgi:hypothetical protein|nr:hypothetical protein [Tepidisphaeraceae bacterium]
MRIQHLLAILLFALALAAHLTGCTRSHDSLSDTDTDPLHGDRIGYYEVPYQGVVYVLGSIQSLDKLRDGKPPQTTAGGFSSQGQSVLFETNNAGITQRLMAEYEKRHGLSSR